MFKKRKGPLFVVSQNCPLVKAASNIPGVDVVAVRSINAELLAPGCQCGRLTLYTRSAIEELDKYKLYTDKIILKEKKSSSQKDVSKQVTKQDKAPSKKSVQEPARKQPDKSEEKKSSVKPKKVLDDTDKSKTSVKASTEKPKAASKSKKVSDKK